MTRPGGADRRREPAGRAAGALGGGALGEVGEELTGELAGDSLGPELGGSRFEPVDPAFAPRPELPETIAGPGAEGPDDGLGLGG
ncbi:MAG: hypothetical protein ACRD29_01695 [Acidimicrobiales bacterium]